MVEMWWAVKCPKDGQIKSVEDECRGCDDFSDREEGDYPSVDCDYEYDEDGNERPLLKNLRKSKKWQNDPYAKKEAPKK